MPRRNRAIRPKAGATFAGRQKGKRGKRPRDWHNTSLTVRPQPALPDVGSGADPTAGTPTSLRDRRQHRGQAL